MCDDAGEQNTAAKCVDAHLRSKDILSLRKHDVQHSINRVLQGLDVELQQATEGTLLFPVPVLLQRISKLCKLHPSVKVFILQSRVRVVWALLAKECEQAIVKQDELSIPQLTSAQASLGLYCATFWEQLASMRFWFHDSMTAVITLHSYATLYNCNVAPQPSQDLERVFLAGIAHHIDALSALGLSNACWALSKLQISGLDALWPQVQLTVAQLCQVPGKLSPEDVACIAYALGDAKKPLGCAQEPFLRAVQETSRRMNAKQVSRTMRGIASMGLNPGKAHNHLMRVVEQQVCCEVVSTNQMPYLVITITAFADSKLPVGRVHEALMSTLHSNMHRMNPAFIAATVSACGKMYQVGSAHQELIEPLRSPLEDAVKASADRMDAKAVSNTVTGLARMNSTLGAARDPLSRAIVREAGLLVPWRLSGMFMAYAMMQREFGERQGEVTSAMRAALQAPVAWGDVSSRGIGEVFWAVGMLRMDPGARTTRRLLDAAGMWGAVGMSVYDAERVMVGLSWLQRLGFPGSDIAKQVSSVMEEMQGIVDSAGD